MRSALNVNTHGIHRKCYQKLTNISNIKSRKRQQPDEDNTVLSTSKRASSLSILFPSDQCLFRGKNRIQGKRVSEYPTFIHQDKIQTIKPTNLRISSRNIMAIGLNSVHPTTEVN